MTGMARHAAKRRRRRLLPLVALVALVVIAASAAVTGLLLSRHPVPRDASATQHARRSSAHTTTSSAPTTTTTSTLPATAPGFEAGHVTAVGDSVMLDYQEPLETDIPGVNVQAAVSEQWSAGEAALQQLKSDGQLGSEVIVALSTNGPITDADFDDMMGILRGASRIVFVNIHVDRPWQDSNNQVLADGAARYKNVVIADWATLADENPQWFGPDGTHLAIDGSGAVALASLISSTLTGG
jgi:hypothetical protein